MPRSNQFPSQVFLRIRASALMALTAVSMAAWSQATPEGRWITASGNLEVEIASCGENLCGLVTKVLGNRSMSRDGEEMKAVDPRPALHMKILDDFKPDETDNNRTVRWKGALYNRENGKTYACQMSLGPHGELILRPYVIFPLFGKTQIWQHASATTSSKL